MKKFISFFNLPLTITLVFAYFMNLIIAITLFIFPSASTFNSYIFNLGPRILFVYPLFICSAIGLMHILISIYSLIFKVGKQTKETHAAIKKTILASSIGLIICIILYNELFFFGILPGYIRGCLTGDTNVVTPHGNIKIADLKEGSEVVSYNPLTKSILTEHIEIYRFFSVSDYYLINNSLKATSEHPFAVNKSGAIVWKKVKDLTPGDILVSLNNTLVEVKTIKKVHMDDPITVYNPQVSGQHNYYVVIGNTAVLIHNKLTR